MPKMLTLAQAADELGVAAATLRRQAAKKVLRAELMGKTYVITERELERYRREHLGQHRGGRPRKEG